MIDFNKIHDEYYKKFRAALAAFTFDSDRFTEENQTVNFCQAVQAVYNDAIVWYEYPWKSGKKQGNQKSSSSRYDAVIYLPEEKTLLIVEAKCLRGCDAKYEAMRNDLYRIIKNKNNHSTFIKDTNVKDVFAVILADYWKPGPKATYYTNVHEVWRNNCIPIRIEKLASKPFKKFIEYTKKHSDPNWVPQWSVKGGLIQGKDYFLLSMIGKL